MSSDDLGRGRRADLDLPPAERRCKADGCRGWTVHGQEYCSAHLRMVQRMQSRGETGPVYKAPETQNRPCAFDGCLQYAMTGRDYCVAHDPDRTRRRRCAFRGCRSLVLADTNYCRFHAEYSESEDAVLCSPVPHEIEAMMARLDAHPGMSTDTLEMELDLVLSVRRLFLQGAKDLTGRGWHGMSPSTLVRTWLATTDAVANLVKAQFVIDQAGDGDVGRMLDSVYRRLEDRSLGAGEAPGRDDPVRAKTGRQRANPDQLLLPVIRPDEATQEAVKGLLDWARASVSLVGRAAVAQAITLCQETDYLSEDQVAQIEAVLDSDAVLGEATQAGSEEPPPMPPSVVARIAAGLSRALGGLLEVTGDSDVREVVQRGVEWL